jgi:hypothetical protein
MPAYLPLLTWGFAIAAAASALGAALGKGVGFMSPVWAGRLLGLSYALMGLSMALFIVRGFSE